MADMHTTTKIGCRNACSYCPQDTLTVNYRERSRVCDLDFDVFQTCVDKIPLDVGIVFAGMSEPWLNPECTKMLVYAYERGHKIKVKTTLVGMSLSDVDVLEKIPFAVFEVHLPSIQGYEKIQIDEDYLKVLDRITKSDIKIRYHCHGEDVNPKVKSLFESSGAKVGFRLLHRRAGNIKIRNKPNLPKRRGTIGCRWHLSSNVLLPNGDVLLCSNDYGMKHILGNLISSSYESLYRGEEFVKVMKGQKDDSLDILCRHCDNFCYNLGFVAKARNWMYTFDRYYLSKFIEIHSFGGILKVTKRAFSKVRKRNPV